MATRVIVPPEPLLTPADIPGSHAADDAQVALIIAAATAEIDGPEGWLGRALGPQMLEMTLPDFDWTAARLSCPPIIEVSSVSYRDALDGWQTVDSSIWVGDGDMVRRRLGQSWPSVREREGAVRIRYRAGYNDVAVDDGGTGPLPDQVKIALKLTVVHAMAIGAENLFLRSEEVDGIGTTTYTISTVASDLILRATERYLNGLRIYS